MAKFKVGDKVKIKNLFKPERGEETGVVTGYDTNGLVLIRDDNGIKIQASEKLVRLANSVRATNTKWIIYYRDGAKEKIEAPTREAAKREADKRSRESGRGYKGVIVDDGVDYGTYSFFNSIHDTPSVNSVCTTNAVVQKAMAMNAVRRKPIKKGRYSGESGDMTYYVNYTADKWFAKKYGKDGTNVTEIKILGPYEKDSDGRERRHILYLFESGWETIKAKDQKTRSLVEAIMRNPKVVKQGDESFAWNSKMVNSKQKKETEIKQIEKAIGRKLTDEEFWIVGDRIFDAGLYGGDREVNAIISELKAGKQLKSRSKNHVHNSVVAKALNAVRNAWADAPDAATAKRDIEQTVRKATEIAKKRSGAKATYKMTPNDYYWCGYIELTFNTEEEAKKYNPYYLFDELGDNKSILPKWSWAISSFNYQKNGKVVKIFVGRLAT